MNVCDIYPYDVNNQKCFYYILPSFDIHNYGKFSPGKILLEKLLFWTFENKIKIFDFTGGNEMYKDLWWSFISYKRVDE